MNRRIMAVLLLVLVIGGVGFGIMKSHRGVIAAQGSTSPAARTLKASVGSEKAPLLADADVVAALSKAGYGLQVDKAGSREIVKGYKSGAYDLGWPSGAPAGAALKAESHAEGETNPMFTPLVIATWKPIADILEANGVVSGQGQFRKVDMHRLAALMLAGKRWSDLQHADAYPVGKSILVTTTDVRKSNSAMMYLALLSYIENGDQVVSDKVTAQAMGDKLAPLFLRQGFQEESSAGPFEDMMAMGMGKTPLLFAYESQVVEHLLDPAATHRGDVVVLYPSPTIESKNVAVPFGPDARKVVQILATDPSVQAAAHRYGYRLPGDGAVPAQWRKAGIQAPDTVIDEIDPPSFEMLEAMITVIEGKFQ